jgi:hypothetical protein
MDPFHHLLFQDIGAALTALDEGQSFENDHDRAVHPEREVRNHSSHGYSAYMALHGTTSVFLLSPD